MQSLENWEFWKEVAMAKVTVIIPTYNRSKLAEEAVECVLNQSFTDFEVIVVDDGSTDDTSDVIKAIPDKRVKYFYQENHGVDSARNLGLKHSSGQYIGFLDSDDLFAPDHLELMVKTLDENPDYSLAYGSYINVYPDGTSQKALKDDLQFSGTVTNDYFGDAPVIGFPTILVRRSGVKTQLYFDENLKICGDLDFFLRASTEAKFIHVPQSILTRRFLDDNISYEMKFLYEPITVFERFYSAFKHKAKIPKSIAHKYLSKLYKRSAKENLAKNNRRAAIRLILRAIRYFPFSLKYYKILLRAILKSKKHDPLPDWHMPQPLSDQVIINGKSVDILN